MEDVVEIKSKILTLVSFWILGLCNNFGYTVMLSSAHDILKSKSAESGNDGTISSNFTLEEYTHKKECNHLSTGVILLVDIIPGLLIKIISPFFPLYVNQRLSICVGLTIASFLTVANANTEFVAAIGVALTSVASGLGESTLLSYMINYERFHCFGDHNSYLYLFGFPANLMWWTWTDVIYSHTSISVITSWSSGTGAAGILGALTYAGLTGVLKLSPTTTMYIMLFVPGLMTVSFWILLEHPPKNKKSVACKSSLDSSTQNQNFSSKISHIPALLKFMIPLGFVYFFEYLINQGLFEMIYFENIWLTHAEQYRWYQVLYQLGVFISRTSVNLFPIEKIWILTILQGLNVIFFLTETLYSYTQSIFIIFAMIGFEGLIGGSAYANSYHNVMKKVQKDKQEFSMAMTSLSDSIGISLSGLLAIPLHNRICQIPK